MAQNFIRVLLAQIPATVARWIEWADGALSPVHASILVDPDGASIDGGNPLAVKGRIFRASASFTRPLDTTAYAVGDLIANSTTAGDVVPVAFDLGVTEALIRGLDLHTTNTAIPASVTIRAHLFDAVPTFDAGDNDASGLSTSGVGAVGCSGRHIGYIDVTPDTWLKTKASGQGGPSSGTVDIHFVSPDGASTTVWVVFEARTAFPPASGSVLTGGLVGIAA